MLFMFKGAATIHFQYFNKQNYYCFVHDKIICTAMLLYHNVAKKYNI